MINHAPQGAMLHHFCHSQSFVSGLIGPLGSGKTFEAVYKILDCINNQPPDRNNKRRSRWLVMRNTLVDLKSTTIKDWRSVVGNELGPFNYSAPITHHLKWLHQDMTTIVEAEVLFVGFDDLGDIKKLRGFQLTGLWVDEAKEMAKEIIDMAIGRLKRYPAKGEIDGGYPSYALLTSNAPAGDEWLAETVRADPEGWDIKVQPGGVIKINGKWVPNPEAENLANLDSTYYAGQLANKKEGWIRANLANEFVHAGSGRPVHEDFNERVHVADYPLEPTGGVELHIGADWGRTPAGIFIQYQPNGQIWVLREVTTVNTSAGPFANAMRQFINQHFEGYDFGDGYGDPAGASAGQDSEDSCFEIVNAEPYNLDLFPAPCPTNDFDLRTAALDSRLTTLVGGEPAILIDKRCVKLVAGLAGAYNFKRVAVAGYEARYHDKPDKTPESHVCEALHYVLLGCGEGDNVTSGSSSAEFAEIEKEFGGWHPDQSVYE